MYCNNYQSYTDHQGIRRVLCSSVWVGWNRAQYMYWPVLTLYWPCIDLYWSCIELVLTLYWARIDLGFVSIFNPVGDPSPGIDSTVSFISLNNVLVGLDHVQNIPGDHPTRYHWFSRFWKDFRISSPFSSTKLYFPTNWSTTQNYPISMNFFCHDRPYMRSPVNKRYLLDILRQKPRRKSPGKLWAQTVIFPWKYILILEYKK